MENQVDQSTGDGTIETKALGELNLNTVNDHQGNSCTEAGKTVNWGGQDIEPADENDGPDQEDNKSVATSAAVTATKKRKKKPKSKRGLVTSDLSQGMVCPKTDIPLFRASRLGSRNTTLILQSRQPSTRRKDTYTTRE